MLIKFADNTTLEVQRVMGGPQMMQGATRDVLTIEVDPAVASAAELKAIFTNPEKTAELISIDNSDPENIKEAVMGQYYTLYISSGNEVRENKQTLGAVDAPQIQEFNYAKIAQLTYSELALAEMQTALGDLYQTMVITGVKQIAEVPDIVKAQVLESVQNR